MVVNGEAEEDGMENAEKTQSAWFKGWIISRKQSFLFNFFFNLSFFMFVQSFVFSHAYLSSCFCWPL